MVGYVCTQLDCRDPSVLSNLTPTAPISSPEFNSCTMRENTLALISVSGFRNSSTSPDESSYPALLPPANPRFTRLISSCAAGYSLSIRSRQLTSLEALSTTITSNVTPLVSLYIDARHGRR